MTPDKPSLSQRFRRICTLPCATLASILVISACGSEVLSDTEVMQASAEAATEVAHNWPFSSRRSDSPRTRSSEFRICTCPTARDRLPINWHGEWALHFAHAFRRAGSARPRHRRTLTYRGTAQKAISNAVLVVDDPHTPALVDAAKCGASRDVTTMLDDLSQRLVANPTHAN